MVVFTLKLGAFALTGSVGLLSDALESTVNIVAAVVALVALRAAARPGDERHHFGLSKAEYFSALRRGPDDPGGRGADHVHGDRSGSCTPSRSTSLGVGLAISVVASVINGAVAGVLMRAGRKHRSIVLVADAKHLMTDVWTSAGVIVGVVAVGLTGILRLDPLIAMVVALNIVYAGLQLIGSSAMGLLDASLPDEENAAIVEILQRHQTREDPLPRAADPRVRAAAVRLDARPGPRGLVGHARARPARDRGGRDP